MASRVERHTVRSPLRIGYVFATPVVLLAAVYLCVFLGLNSGRGSAFVADQISAALYGELSYRYLEVGPGLTRLDLYAAETLPLVPFYERAGFHREGALFDIPGIVGHYLMHRMLR